MRLRRPNSKPLGRCRPAQYSAAPGTVIDVIDSDAAQLEANG
jgi:hypothetical protein